MSAKANLPRVVRVKSTMPVDELEAFDIVSRFLAAEKAKQLSHDFGGQAYFTSSSQTWNDLRLACNSLLDDNDPRREPVAAWKDETALNEAVTPTPTPTKGVKLEESDADESDNIEHDTPATTEMSDKEAKKSSKKAKKEAKKAKKEAKKTKKEKKRKRKSEA